MCFNKYIYINILSLILNLFRFLYEFVYFYYRNGIIFLYIYCVFYYFKKIVFIFLCVLMDGEFFCFIYRGDC